MMIGQPSRPSIEVVPHPGGAWAWVTRHPRTGMVLRSGRAGSKHKAERRARRSAGAWVRNYGGLQPDWTPSTDPAPLVATEDDPE